MAKKTFSPQAFRSLLVVALVVAILGSGGLFYAGLTNLGAFATEVNHTIADADASRTQIQTLQTLKNQLSQSESLTTKANQMFATPATYQNEAITDIRNYATAANITVTKINFDEITPGAYPTVTVSLKSPVSYIKFIQFLDDIESNVPKMLVTSVGISHINNGSADSITVDDIKIMIATR